MTAAILVDEQRNADTRRSVRVREQTARVALRLAEATLDVYGSLGFTPIQGLNFAVSDDQSNTGAYAQIQPPLFHLNQKRGEAIPVYITEEQLRWLRDRSRILCYNNEFALCGIENRINYIVGDDGLKYTARPIDRNNKEAVRAAAQVQEFIDAFGEVNDLPEIEAEALWRYDSEGEFFLRLFPDEYGMSELRFIEPEHVRAPNGDSWPANYSFGVETPENDVSKPVAYHVIESPLTTGWKTDRVSEAEIVHVKANVKSNAKRGIPTYYPVESNLRRCEDLLASMTSMAKARAKIALIRTLTGVTSDVAQNLFNQLTDIRVTDPATSEQLNLERLRYATILTTGQNAQYQFPPGNVGASDYVEVLQAELRGIAARLQMSEWMFTCLADAKYSNAFVVEAPTLRAFKRIQTRLCRRLGTGRYGAKKSLIWRAVEFAIDGGLLPKSVTELVKIDAKGPSLEARDKGQEATTNQTYYDMGIKSGKTIQAEQGLDPEEEAVNIADERTKNRRKVAIEQIATVTTVQNAFYAGQIPRDAAGAILAVLGFAAVECEALLPPPQPVSRQAQPALPAGAGPTDDDSAEITDPGHFSDEMEYEGNPNDVAVPVREAFVYVEGDHPRASDGTWIAKNGPYISKAHVDKAKADAREGNHAPLAELRRVVHPEDRAKLERHIFDDNKSATDQRVFNERAAHAGHLRNLGWARGNKFVDHVIGVLDEIRATGKHDHLALFHEFSGLKHLQLPILRNVMRTMGVKHKDFPKTKDGIKNLIWSMVKAEVDKAHNEYHERGKLVASLLGHEPRELATTASREQAQIESTLIQLREAGFSGTITDSLGRTYHFVNGVRVTGPDNHTPHPESHATPHEIASMTGAHPEAGISELATPLHDLVAKLKKQKKNHTTIAGYVEKHAAGLSPEDRAHLEQHFGKLDSETVLPRVNELFDGLKRHAKTASAVEPSEPVLSAAGQDVKVTPETPKAETPEKGDMSTATQEPETPKAETPEGGNAETAKPGNTATEGETAKPAEDYFAAKASHNEKMQAHAAEHHRRREEFQAGIMSEALDMMKAKLPEKLHKNLEISGGMIRLNGRPSPEMRELHDKSWLEVMEALKPKVAEGKEKYGGRATPHPDTLTDLKSGLYFNAAGDSRSRATPKPGTELRKILDAHAAREPDNKDIQSEHFLARLEDERDAHPNSNRGAYASHAIDVHRGDPSNNVEYAIERELAPKIEAMQPGIADGAVRMAIDRYRKNPLQNLEDVVKTAHADHTDWQERQAVQTEIMQAEKHFGHAMGETEPDYHAGITKREELLKRAQKAPPEERAAIRKEVKELADKGQANRAKWDAEEEDAEIKANERKERESRETVRRQRLTDLAPKSPPQGRLFDSGSEHPELDHLEDLAISQGHLRDGEILKGGSYEKREKALRDLLTRAVEDDGKQLSPTLAKAHKVLIDNANEREDDWDEEKDAERSRKESDAIEAAHAELRKSPEKEAVKHIRDTTPPEHRAQTPPPATTPAEAKPLSHHYDHAISMKYSEFPQFRERLKTATKAELVAAAPAFDISEGEIKRSSREGLANALYSAALNRKSGHERATAVSDGSQADTSGRGIDLSPPFPQTTVNAAPAKPVEQSKPEIPSRPTPTVPHDEAAHQFGVKLSSQVNALVADAVAGRKPDTNTLRHIIDSATNRTAAELRVILMAIGATADSVAKASKDKLLSELHEWTLGRIAAATRATQ